MNQRNELDARELLISEIFKEKTLAHIISDHNSGITLITKILSTCCVSVEERCHLIDCVRKVLGQVHQKLEGSLNYKRLLDELNSSDFLPAPASAEESSSSSKDNRSRTGAGRGPSSTHSKQQHQNLGSPVRSAKADANQYHRSHDGGKNHPASAVLPTPHQSPSYPGSGSYYYKDYI